MVHKSKAALKRVARQLNEEIPGALQRNVKMIRKLDEQIDSQALASALPARQKLEQDLLLSTLKQELALQSYELLDHFSKKLDRKMMRFVRADEWNEDLANGEGSGSGSTTLSATTRTTTTTTTSHKKKKKKTMNAGDASSFASPSAPRARHQPTPGVNDSFEEDERKQLNMEVDPNEPTYCICGQVAFGEMIACDGEDCEKEWFHTQCVGVNVARNADENWYCNDCLRQMQNR